MKKEATARIKINILLQNAGWRFFDDEKGPTNIVLENNVKISKSAFDKFGKNFEKTENGFIDFLLLDTKGFPWVVLEAKSEDKDPLDGKEQARSYAESQNVRFIILSNGNLNYFWDLEHGNPNVITTFPTPDSLLHFQSFKPDPTKLADEEVNEDYIALTQNPNYQKDPRWTDEGQKEDFVKEQDLKFLWPYQLKAIQSLQVAAKKNNDRYLFEMATGTGKTLISAAVIKLFLKTGNAKRILFIVDRLELEDQAFKNFVRYLKNDFTTVIYKENQDDWRKAEVVVSTVQSLIFNNKYIKLFSPTDFDLVISDEAHRSISGNSRALFEYFIGYKLGLTATPKDYLKNLDPDKISSRDPRQWERRQLLDTYQTFGCTSGDPTFRYSLVEAVKNGYLVNPVVIDARTEITTELLSEKGYSIITRDEENNKGEEQIYFQRDFEKKLFSEKTNLIFCETFLKNALKDPISGEIGKSIVFCVSQRHASKITQMLNQLADKYFPEKYKSDFALQVTSNITDSQQFTINFANNNLNGKTKWLEGYKSSKTRVCVTVGMMTTGYDCQDILNLCLMRPIFSPTDFIQIKGRGTRKFVFQYKDIEKEDYKKDKMSYRLFDFFANCEYFEEKYNYDEIIKLPPILTDTEGGGGGISRDEVKLNIPDPLKTLKEKTVGIEGMKVDRKFYEKFEEKVKTNSFIKENFEKGNIDAVEQYIRDEIFEHPKEYFNLEKLRKSIKSDRRITLREFLEKIFGIINTFKTKDELLEEEFEKFISIYKPENMYILPIKNFLKAYITDSEVRDIVESKEYGRFATNSKVTMEDFKSLNGWRDILPEYVKDYVSINTFM
ncbi:MAG: DEAD/DEAH box helicase family protein [Elusimicrobiota bacterium]